jgi:hypothetical protein
MFRSLPHIRTRLFSLFIVLASALGFGCGKPHVLVVGLDGANWTVLNPLIDAGLLPNIGQLVRNGASAGLDCEPADPVTACFCPPVWTSIATGVPFADHRLRGLHQPSFERRVKAIWNVVDDYGGIVTTSSWRGTWPPEPGIEFVLTEPGLDAAAEELYEVWQPLDHPAHDLPEPLYNPPDILDLLGLLPATGNRPPIWAMYGRDRAAMESMLELAATRAGEKPWERETELTMILIHGPDKVGHILWETLQEVMYGFFDAPKLLDKAASWDGPIELAGPFGWGPVAGPYLEADAWLGRLLALHEYDYVVFVSDHGMTRNAGPGLPGHHNLVSREAHTGIFAVHGPGVRAGSWLGEVSVFDVAPTLAYLLDLPVAEDLPGRVLEEAFTQQWLHLRPVDTWTVPSWELPPDLEGRPARPGVLRSGGGWRGPHQRRHPNAGGP